MDEYGYIGDYFNGLLSINEAAMFDKKIQEDPAFAEEVAFYVQTMQQVKDQVKAEKKERFRDLYKPKKHTLAKGSAPVIFMNRWKSIVVAAAVIILCAITWLLWPSPTPTEMAEKYVEKNFFTLPATMGETDSLQMAIRLTNNNQLPEALLIFKQLAKAGSKNESAIKNAGIVSLRLKNYDQALIYFSRLQQMQYLNSNPGKFYTAITLLNRNLGHDNETAKSLLQDVVTNNLQGKAYAEQILKTW